MAWPLVAGCPALSEFPGFTQPSFWHWWALALLLVTLEVFVPSTFLLGPAGAALIIGVLALIVPGVPLGWLILIFAILAIALTIAIRNYVRQHPPDSDRPMLNRGAARLVGQSITLDEDLIDGRGSVKIGDSRWRARTADGRTIRRGRPVQVSDHDGAELIVSECAGENAD